MHIEWRLRDVHPNFLRVRRELERLLPNLETERICFIPEKDWDVQLHGDTPCEPTMKAFVNGRERAGWWTLMGDVPTGFTRETIAQETNDGPMGDQRLDLSLIHI